MVQRDDTPIFGAVAPAYYAKSLPVIPLHFHDKKPIPNHWSEFHNQPVPADTQQEWLSRYANCNIGIVLGEQSGLMMIDIDTEDERLLAILQSVLPPSPWVRVGRKGMVMAYKRNGVKTFRIKDISGGTIVECLADRTQVVLPPSIHPDTKMPYRANTDLLAVIDQLPVLDQQIEAILRGKLKDAGVELSHSGWTRVTDFVSKGARDTQMTGVAGVLASGITRGEITLKEAIDRLYAWHSMCVENVAGDPIDISKGIQNIVRFLARDVMEKGKALPKGWDEGLSDEEKAQLAVTFTDDHEEWSFEQIKNYLRAEFERHPEESQGRALAIEFTLKKMAMSNNISRIDEDRIIRYIVEVGGMRVLASSLKARLKELRQGELKGTDHTEIARAVLSDVQQYGEVRYYAEAFWQWKGDRWVKMEEAEFLKLIAENYGSLQLAKRYADHKGILQTLKSLVPRSLRTSDVLGVNFANGYLTRELKLLPHSPDYGATYVLPFRYMPDQAGKFPKFEEFLYRAWGQDEDYQQKLDALQEMLCVTIFGMGPSYQRACLLFGVAATGKSQLLEIARSLMPEDARSSVSPEEWGDKFAPTKMLGSLINVCGELSETRKIDGERFKMIVDGTEINGQYKGGQLFPFRPICTHWFASNHLPVTRDTSEGFNRRWLILHFNNPVKAEERVNDLGSIIAAEEREAIVAWAVEALPRLKAKQGFTLPPSHVQLMREVANSNNSVRFFIQESPKIKIVPPTISPDGRKISVHTLESDLFRMYSLFCLQEQVAGRVSSKNFRSKMRELAVQMGFEVKIDSKENGMQVCSYENLMVVDGQGT